MIFDLYQGPTIELEDVLNRKEERVFKIQELINQFPEKTIVSYKLNIPGPIKTSEIIKNVFMVGSAQLPFNFISSTFFLDLKTGPEAIYVIDSPKQTVKLACVQIEEEHPLGRLFDFDVNGINRHDLNLPPRTCLICHQEAKLCGRSRNHSVKEMLSVIEDLILNYYNENKR